MTSPDIKQQAASETWFDGGIDVLKPLCAFSFSSAAKKRSIIDVQASAESLERSAAEWTELFKEPSSRISMAIASAVVTGVSGLLTELKDSLLKQSKSSKSEFRQSTEGRFVVVQAEVETCAALVLELFHEAASGGDTAVSSFQVATAVKSTTQLLKMFSALVTELVIEEPLLVQGEWSDRAVTQVAGMSAVVRTLSNSWGAGLGTTETIAEGLGLNAAKA